MRVAFLPGSFRPDRCGVSHYTAHLMDALRFRGVQCSVMTTQAAAEHHQRGEVMGGTVGWGPGMLLSLPGAIRRLNPDILHIQHAAGSFDFRRAVFWLPQALRAAGWRGPIVVTLHEYGWWEWKGPLWKSLGPWGEKHGMWDREDFGLLVGANKIIVTHDGALRTLVSRLPQLSGRVAQVPIGPNIPLLATNREMARAALRARFGWPHDTPIISYFGFVHPVKGIETLLRAFERVLAAYPQARLLLNGGIHSLALHDNQALQYQQKLQRLIGELGLDNAVRLTGYQPDSIISQHLSGADVGVLPFNDGVTLKSGSLLAMWSHGLPVVATRPAVSPPELDRACRLVPSRSPEALADALAKLLADPDARRELGERAQAAAAAYSWETIAERHLEIYQAISNRREHG